MKNYRKWLVGLLLTLLACAAVLPGLMTRVAAQPGDAVDPLVTRRYVNERVDAIWSEIQALRAENAALRLIVEAGGTTAAPDGTINLEALTETILTEVLLTFEDLYGDRLRNIDGLNQQQPPAETERELEFTTINVAYNQVLTLDNGAEAILRNGNAVIVAEGNVGLVDMTAGRDIRAGESVPRNHLLIAPRTDGRGLRFTSESSWVMVRGSFTLE